MDRKGVWSFLAITFVITYAIEGALILSGFRISPGVFLWGQYIVVAVMWVPALATIVTIRFVTHEGFGIANIRFGGWRPYVAAGFIIPACFVVTYGATWALGLGRPDWSLRYVQDLIAQASRQGGQRIPSPAAVLPALYLATLTLAPFINGILGFGEELGWRGYLLPKLLPLGKPRAYILLGVVWGLWHLPLLLVGFTYPGHPFAGVLMFMLLTTVFGIYLNELTLRHRSSVLAGWAHGVFNSQKLGMWPLLFPDTNPFLGGYAGVVGIAVLLLLGILESRKVIS